MRVSAFTTSTTASGTTAFFMHAMLKPYTSSQNAMRSRCFRVSPTAARLMLQRSGYTVEKREEQKESRIVPNICKHTDNHVQAIYLLQSLSASSPKVKRQTIPAVCENQTKTGFCTYWEAVKGRQPGVSGAFISKTDDQDGQWCPIWSHITVITFSAPQSPGRVHVPHIL